MQLKGKIIKWNGEKAFGFIAPFAGGSQIFIHVSAFRNRARVPQLNDVVTFTVSKDKDGRYRAEDARYAGEKLKEINGEHQKARCTFWQCLAVGPELPQRSSCCVTSHQKPSLERYFG